MNRKKWHYVLLFALFTAIILTPTVSAANQKTLLDTIKQRAEQGKMLNSKYFAIGNNLHDVEAKWGSAEDKSTFAANYPSHHIRFYYEKNTITGMDDFDPRLQNITWEQIRYKYGKPVSAVEFEGNYYVTYRLHNKLNLIFVFQSSVTNKNPNLELYQIS